jgi:hypothetical protein
MDIQADHKSGQIPIAVPLFKPWFNLSFYARPVAVSTVNDLIFMGDYWLAQAIGAHIRNKVVKLAALHERENIRYRMEINILDNGNHGTNPFRFAAKDHWWEAGDPWVV